MSALEIVKYPEKVLRKKCKPVSKITKKEQDFFDQMLFTMRYFQGIGLAAPQIGIPEKLIVVEFEGSIIKLANPEVIQVDGADIMIEGCLSFPDEVAVSVKRPTEAIMRGLDENNRPIEIKAKGILARVLQHEIDHLSGKLIIDYLPFWEKLKFKLKAGR